MPWITGVDRHREAKDSKAVDATARRTCGVLCSIQQLVGFLHSVNKCSHVEIKPYRIMLCDDDPDEALFLETAFRGAGFQVDLEWFNRCSTLLDHLPGRAEVPDLIFIDLNMPGENGLECLARVKTIPAYKKVPVIMYTTSTLSRDIMEAFKKGASLYLPKTNSEEELIEMVRHVISMDRIHLECPKKEGFCYCPKKAKD
jgi:CheY-like chemotaxis protein